ncbi:MAG: rhodanese-like domain-containing protein [Oscillospiraceae bacterium]|nr:rhodanese-like domain-containing protein [Oscillospiraceae bacterium]
MGLFTKTADINKGVDECRATPGAVLLDVRTPEEYAEGHIPGSVSIPLAALPARYHELGAPDTPLFVHCLSGGRSGQAVRFLQGAGFTRVKNIGGINAWTGKVEK